MEPKDFIKRLKRDNPYFEDLEHTIVWLRQNKTMQIERRSSKLLETIQGMLRSRVLPVVDKKLGFIFGVGESNHMMVRCSLFRYHNADGKGLDVPHIPPRESADEYIRQGMGYYFSSMATRTIIASLNYRQHPEDKDVFLTYKVQEDYF